MNCSEFQGRIDQVLDSRRAPTSDIPLRDHASTCPRCSQLLDSYLAMLQGVRRLEMLEPACGFSERVAIGLARHRRLGWPSRRAVVVLAAAAACLLAVTPWLVRDDGAGRGAREMARKGSTTRSSSVEKVGESSPSTARTPDRAAPKVDTPPSDNGVSEIARVAQKSVSGVLLWGPMSVALLPRAASERSGGHNTPAGGWVDEFAEGLQPLSDSTAGALDGLLDALPGESNDRSS